MVMTPFSIEVPRLVRTLLILVLASSGFVGHILAEDWNAYPIVPVSAPGLVLEAVGAGTSEGTVVSINKPSGAANQKWVVSAKSDEGFVIRPVHGAGLVAAAAKGGEKNGTLIVLEKETGRIGSFGD